MTFEQAKKHIKALYQGLAKIPAVSGDEELFCEKVQELVCKKTQFFDKITLLPNGGLLMMRKSKSSNAKTLLIDAHLDTVGFTVSEILGEGFLRVAPTGGIDRRLLYASEIEIYGKKTIKGIFVSNPPHINKSKEGAGLPEISEIYVDTGLSHEKLCAIVSVGDSCGYVFSPCELLNDNLCGKSMDNRICAAGMLLSAIMLEKENADIPCNVVMSFSPYEETSCVGGAFLGRLCADAAIVTDVNFGRAANIPENIRYPLGEGAGVSFSSTTSIKLTKALFELADSQGIPLGSLVETSSTGTNANKLSYAYLGTPCAVLSIPQKNMHSANEIVNMHDVFSFSRLLCAAIKSFPDIALELESGRIIKKLPSEVQDANGL